MSSRAKNFSKYPTQHNFFISPFLFALQRTRRECRALQLLLPPSSKKKIWRPSREYTKQIGMLKFVHLPPLPPPATANATLSRCDALKMDILP